MLLFEFENRPKRLMLKLRIGPGPEEIRRKFFERARKGQPFKASQSMLARQWNEIYSRPILDSRAYEKGDTNELRAQIRATWEEFLSDDLAKLTEALRQEIDSLAQGSTSDASTVR